MKLRAFSPYFSEKVVLTMGSTLVPGVTLTHL